MSESERQKLIAATAQRGGFVATKRNSDGSESPYELNINYFDALNDSAAGEPLELQVQRFLGAQSIMLAMAGVPGIYIHSLLGSRGAPAEVERTGRPRSINREKFGYAALQRELADPGGRRRQVLDGFRGLLQWRRHYDAFHPNAPQRVLETQAGVFALVREGCDTVVCVHNLTMRPQTVGARILGVETATDLLSGERVGGDGNIALAPLQTRWLVPP